MIVMRRVYDPPDGGDGVRILVDRLWPRGLNREAAAVDIWLKDIAPDDDLRRWFAHREDRWEAFRERYRAELEEKTDLVRQVRTLAKGRKVTLLYAAHDEEHNNARVLLEYLRETAAAEMREPV